MEERVRCNICLLDRQAELDAMCDFSSSGHLYRASGIILCTFKMWFNLLFLAPPGKVLLFPTSLKHNRLLHAHHTTTKILTKALTEILFISIYSKKNHHVTVSFTSI